MAAGVRTSGAAPGTSGGRWTPERDRLTPERDRPSRERQIYLDNLKVVLIAAIIAIHATLGYAGTINGWTYTEVREATLAPVTEATLFVSILPFGLFVISLLFLVAGLLTAASLECKGAGRFARDRLLRLGVPFIVYVLLVQPATVYALEHPLGAASRSYWYEILGAESQLDTGPLWFVGVLLIFSLAYAGWVWAYRRHTAVPEHGRIRLRHLVWLAVAVAPASFLIRLVYPYGGDSGFTDLNFWQWPACAALFGLGVVAWRQGWLTGVPDPLVRRSRTVTLYAVAAMAVLALATGSLDRVDDMLGGWNWLALAFAATESILVVFGSVWLLSVARRDLDRPLRWAGPAVRRSSFAAFIVQTPVLIGLAVALRAVPVPAEVKALVVAGGGVAASFALGWLLVDRVPGANRVL